MGESNEPPRREERGRDLAAAHGQCPWVCLWRTQFKSLTSRWRVLSPGGSDGSVTSLGGVEVWEAMGGGKGLQEAARCLRSLQGEGPGWYPQECGSQKAVLNGFSST